MDTGLAGADGSNDWACPVCNQSTTLLHMSAPEEDVEAEASEGTAAAEPPEPPIPHYTETLAWVGRFAYQFLSWELAVDGSGRLIRVRKSR